MIKTLTLKNFRKHEDLQLNFSEGLTVIRGSNEAGKTTVGEAILYAYFGASTLREPLEKVVTYTKPENSLKVALEFTLDGVDYKIVRGKSGAELSYSDQLVTGQRETRSFIERLIGCTADTAKLLMFADQNSIRGVLDKGGTAANGLVETLAQLGVIEDLVDRIQSQLSSGNTKSLDAQIETLKGASVEVPPLPEKTQIEAADQEILRVQAKIDLSERAVPADHEVANAVARVSAKNAAAVDLARLSARKAEISATLALPVTLPGFTLEELEQARKDAANIPEQVRRWKSAQVKFAACNVGEWDGTLESAQDFQKTTQTLVGQGAQSLADLRRKFTAASAKRITEKMCAFCDKDLTNVPEVVVLNTRLSAEMESLTEEISLAKVEQAAHEAELATIGEILEVTQKRTQQAGEYWALDDKLPPNPTWIGAPATQPGESKLPGMEKEWNAWKAVDMRRNMLQEELEKIVLPVVPDTTDAEALLLAAEQVQKTLHNLHKESAEAVTSKFLAQRIYDSGCAACAAALKQNAINAQTLAQMVSTRDSMLKHNELIKKLRAARPVIASKMWGTVLGAVSRYFTQIRGEQSVVTRTADGFEVNGRSVQGLSGSTNDALGLAIRMALSKLFLPSVPFLFLDESFASCDNGRELNGITTLAGAGFEQIIMVTHSSAAEPICNTLITL